MGIAVSSIHQVGPQAMALLNLQESAFLLPHRLDLLCFNLVNRLDSSILLDDLRLLAVWVQRCLALLGSNRGGPLVQDRLPELCLPRLWSTVLEHLFYLLQGLSTSWVIISFSKMRVTQRVLGAQAGLLTFGIRHKELNCCSHAEHPEDHEGFPADVFELNADGFKSQ